MNEIQLFVPNKLYKEVWEDNIDLFFERLIYSKEFYDFVKELMIGTRELNKRQTDESQKLFLETASSSMVHVGSKLVLDVLAKAFHNSQMGDITSVLISLYETSDAAVLSFMDNMIKDESYYVLTILLTCQDRSARVNTEKLISFIVNRCFEIEKDSVYEMMDKEYDV